MPEQEVKACVTNLKVSNTLRNLVRVVRSLNCHVSAQCCINPMLQGFYLLPEASCLAQLIITKVTRKVPAWVNTLLEIRVPSSCMTFISVLYHCKSWNSWLEVEVPTSNTRSGLVDFQPFSSKFHGYHRAELKRHSSHCPWLSHHQLLHLKAFLLILSLQSPELTFKDMPGLGALSSCFQDRRPSTRPWGVRESLVAWRQQKQHQDLSPSGVGHVATQPQQPQMDPCSSHLYRFYPLFPRTVPSWGVSLSLFCSARLQPWERQEGLGRNKNRK